MDRVIMVAKVILDSRYVMPRAAEYEGNKYGSSIAQELPDTPYYKGRIDIIAKNWGWRP